MKGLTANLGCKLPKSIATQLDNLRLEMEKNDGLLGYSIDLEKKECFIREFAVEPQGIGLGQEFYYSFEAIIKKIKPEIVVIRLNAIPLWYTGASPVGFWRKMGFKGPSRVLKLMRKRINSQ
jgi:hypothetical protein